MSTVFSEGFESGTNGATITTTNTAYSVVSGSGTAVFDTSVKVAGNLSAKFGANGTTTIILREIFSGGSVTNRYFRRYCNMNALPPSSIPVTIARLRIASTTQAQVLVLNTGQLQIRNANTIIATTTNTVTLNGWFRIEWQVDGTVNATQTLRLFLGSNYSGTTPTETITGTYSGGAYDRVEDGIGTAGFSGSMWIDEVDDDDSTWPGPSGGADTAPVANAGTNQSVTSGQLVTLDGSGSTDSDGTIASYAWSQTSGTTVTFSDPTAVQPTFTAPTVSGSPLTLVFSLAVTDNLGVQSSPSTVTITDSQLTPAAFSEDFEGGSNSAAITTTNTAYGVVAGTPTFDNSAIVSGSLSANFLGTGSNVAILTESLPSSATSRYVRRYIRMSALPSASLTIIRLHLSGGAGTTIGQAIVTATGLLQIRDGTTTVATSVNAITPNTWFRLEWFADGTTTNTQTLKIFLLGNYNGATPNETLSGSFTSGAFNQVQDGIGTNDFSGTLWLDGVSDSTTGYPGPMVSANQAPVANASTDQTVNPGTSVTLDGTASSDADGSVVGYLWKQTSGTNVTLSSSQIAQPTFTSPVTGTTMVFSLIVIDDKGAGSTADSVTITDNGPSIVFNEPFETGPNGATITTSNVTYDTVTGTSTFDNSEAAAGLLSGKMVANSAAVILQETFSSSQTVRYMRRYFMVTLLPSGAGIVTLMRLRLTATTVAQVVLNTGGVLQIRNANTTVATSSTIMPVNAWFRLEWFVDGATTNTQTLRIYTGILLNSAVTPTETITGGYTQGNFNRLQDGVGTVGYTGTLWIDEAQDQLTNWPGPAAGTNQPPIVSAGANQIVLPGDTATLDGSGSVDPDGTIASYAWTQTSGTTVTLSSSTAMQPTFTAPTLASGDTLTFSLVVTDNGGAISQTATVSITVQPSNEFILSGGTWQVSPPSLL